MKLTVTKKEYESLKKVLENYTKELSIIDSDFLDLDLDDLIESEKGKWGEIKVSNPRRDDSTKIIINVNPDFFEDVMIKLYDPMMVKMAKWIAKTYEMFIDLFSDFTKKFEKINKKWFE